MATLLVLMGALGMFSRAQVDTLKSLGIWIVALGGLVLAALLFLTGRGVVAIAALGMLGPLLWGRLSQGGKPGGRPSFGGAPPRAGGGAMTRAEAFEVLGLKPGAKEAEIRAAHLRLMRAAHPDRGGSDWLATRINQARDVLLS